MSSQHSPDEQSASCFKRHVIGSQQGFMILQFSMFPQSHSSPGSTIPFPQSVPPFGYDGSFGLFMRHKSLPSPKYPLNCFREQVLNLYGCIPSSPITDGRMIQPCQSWHPQSRLPTFIDKVILLSLSLPSLLEYLCHFIFDVVIVKSVFAITNHPSYHGQIPYCGQLRERDLLRVYAAQKDLCPHLFQPIFQCKFFPG